MNTLITGASSGIGKAFAYEFAKKGFDLILVARSLDKLEAIKEDITSKYDIQVRVCGCDLCRDYQAVFNYVKENDLRVDVLVNNAGMGDYGRFSESDMDKNIEMMDLNNKALVALSHYFINDMKRVGAGHIINVGSVASFIPGPYMAVYYATKAFVLSFSLALRDELRKDNIKVSVLCPAPTHSNFWEVANGQTTAVYNNIFSRCPEQAAKTGIKMYEKNKAYAIDGLPYKMLIGLARCLPLELCARSVGFIQQKTKGKV